MTGARRVAAIDCGTNSLRLLIAEPDGDRLREVVRTTRTVRLGADVDRTGRLASTALRRTGAALAEYRAMIDAADVADMRMVATSAVRDAVNRDEFDALVVRVLGRPADVVSGIEEAELSFTGACSGLMNASAGAVLVADIGGGSTELVRGTPRSARVDDAVSLDVGSVRMTERHVRSDPPTKAQVAAIEADVRAALSGADGADGAGGADGADGAGTARFALAPADRLVGVAGTVTTVAALALGLERYDSARVQASVLSRPDVDRVVSELLGLDRRQREARAVIHPGRVDVIAAGAVILRALMAHLQAAALTVSEHDILDGIALGLRA